MAKSKVFNTKAPAGDVSFNVVPLVDCAFLMILFFILTSQISSSSIVQLDLPKPTHSSAVDPDAENQSQIIVNVVSAEKPVGPNGDPVKALVGSGLCKEYSINGLSIAPDEDAQKKIASMIRQAVAEDKAKGKVVKEFFVVIRGDQRVAFSNFLPVFAAAADAGVSKMNITVNTGQ